MGMGRLGLASIQTEMKQGQENSRGARLEVSLWKSKTETRVDTGEGVKENILSSKGNNLEEFKVYAELQNYKFTRG